MRRLAAQQITERLTDQGRLIEAGWESFRILVVPPTAGKVQLDETRKAFFAGAQHVFVSMMELVGDDGGEPTPDELRRIDLIDKELEGFVDELRAEIARS